MHTGRGAVTRTSPRDRPLHRPPTGSPVSRTSTLPPGGQARGPPAVSTWVARTDYSPRRSADVAAERREPADEREDPGVGQQHEERGPPGQQVRRAAVHRAEEARADQAV